MVLEFLFYAFFIFAGGFILGYWLRKQRTSTKIKSAEEKAEKILIEVKNKQNDILLKTQDRALKIIDDAKQEEKKRRNEINGLQVRLEQRENTFSQKLLELQDKQQKLYDKIGKVEEVKEKIHQIKKEQVEKLEKIAAMSKDEAQKVLFKNIEAQAQDDLMSRIRKLEDESLETLENKSRDLMASTMQRLVSNYTPEITTTTVDLPSDEMKGRIIGREGRNIKVIEQLTGTEIIVDDTPNVITVSGFSPIRRHIAKRTLDKLILDGRIHPTKIEGAIEESKKELALDIKKAGEDALYEIGIAGFDPKLVQIIGRLKYRTSYGQNALRHSLEVAHLSALLAEELGADVTLAKKGGLLHDIGKAVDHEVQGTHPEIGRDIAKKFHLPQEIIDPIETHHDDKPRNLISVIVKVADAISSARPGARHDTYERYLQRLQELENIANSFEGVEKTYAIQAGREVRVFVTPNEVSDLEAHNIAKDIAKKIEQELKYPGEIKINVIREMRITEYAR
ncbi:ribonuclease Y [Candidatus Falkowbacteria bacterium RIFOXYB2_FULL_34_18]|uniref:Ribonuclease Y n=1 Tax=Candidatus Falkowbacteria bacterium RIFOXYD2_FULL_34_120 TaxID=1798007 RepID=A0A1F5TQX6_9BACT|nr:MAG: ribonuclease Y [Candidatus Falkowbacteria bacterium RIFOXYB2_FULL_34_18]OGF29811.1 MAG: ribonuclease Y [Candidatus Falkowbacteria bacterium RIFOXYC12_FULL_34_55]OGF37074.1 MAG: ribonuclease Y [Candidatus Falkowbacteria bacterium RIFOXYC2_FULL_34_220]OGF39266.1 MAG: ribonuclease Y [Candidatus Falkowbacteria bacterium RIFOXYD12_FULL_34_57]OGF41370.1 MAG: ribonuclease Y [Candidatus Falkowbacteria bacterium RIFOXYD2_FULL_34_120]